jgi:hypothetical protein
VVAYHAKVTTSTSGPASCLSPDSHRIAKVPVCWGPPSAEWSGSTTGPPYDTCKGPALWTFALICEGVEVSRSRLAQLGAPEQVRGLQRQRLSDDLARVPPPK